MSAAIPRHQGIYSPVLTPFHADRAPDHDRFVRHCRWLVRQDVGLAVFGTNSESASLALAEKRRLLDTLLEAGLPAARMMPGTAGCALPETVELTRHAVRAGCAGVLVLPPFYYKNVSDEGLFRAFAGIIEGVADDRLRIYLYHIPAVTQAPLSLSLIARLLDAYPGIVAGVKDSGGDWNHTQAMIERFAAQGFGVFAGSETYLLQTMRAGGAGCITATGNVNPGAMVHLYRGWNEAGSDPDAQQARLDRTRAAFAQFPLIAAMKAALAWKTDNADWLTVRAPLVELNAAQQQELQQALTGVGFELPGAQELA